MYAQDYHRLASPRSRGPAAYAPVNAMNERSGSPSKAQRLPGMGDLFSSKLLIAPGAKRDSVCESESTVQDMGVSIPDSAVCSLAKYSLSKKRSFTEYKTEERPSQGQFSKSGSRTSTLHAILNPESEDDGGRLTIIKSTETSSPLPSPMSEKFTFSFNTPHYYAGISPSHGPQHEPFIQRQSISPYELPHTFFGSSELAPATYVYQAASSYEGVQYIPGKGECHTYKGGYSIPTQMFSDPVSLTKSKILKKRLSVACTNCRRKKIRCEPGIGGCLQCRKSQRPCQM